jgi:hypothetical protein
VGFSCFHGQKKYKIRVSADCSVCTKNLINIKVLKRFILAFKMR